MGRIQLQNMKSTLEGFQLAPDIPAAFIALRISFRITHSSLPATSSVMCPTHIILSPGPTPPRCLVKFAPIWLHE